MPWPSFPKTLYQRSRLEAHLPSRRLAGLEQPLWLSGHSTCSCLRQDAARSWREIPGSGSPRDPLASRRRSKGAGARDLPCAGLQRRWLAAALKDAHPPRRGAQEVPRLHPLFECQTGEPPIGWKWRISNLSQNVYFRRLWIGEYYHIGSGAGESARLSCKFKVKRGLS